MRTILLILDSLGCGALPDAHLYGDEASNTLLHVVEAMPHGSLPNLQKLGLGNIIPLPGILPVEKPLADFGKMMLASPGKDTITGHWEFAGIRLERPFPLYPSGFPESIISEFEKRIGRKSLGNVAASGTEIIAELGEAHMQTGFPIVYTSADSVFQIAAHDDIIPLAELYDICIIAREILQGANRVARVIARPFVGKPGAFVRTANRHDYAIEPPTPNLLTILKDAGVQVCGIGKISDIFCGVGISSSRSTKSNNDGMLALEEALKLKEPDSFYFVNLVDFDSLYGHRNDVRGYANALMEFDLFLPRILTELGEGDRLILTADHGCDPTTRGTDHTREYVPLMIYQAGTIGRDLGIRSSFADIAATECATRGVSMPMHGEAIDLFRKKE